MNFLERNAIRKKQKEFASSGDWQIAIGDRVQEVSRKPDWDAGTVMSIDTEVTGTERLYGYDFPKTTTTVKVAWDDIGKPNSAEVMKGGMLFHIVPHEDYFKDASPSETSLTE